MNIESFRAQLEKEFEWRTAEIRYFHNLCAGIECVEDQKRFRRAIILLLYSHFEGYCKFSLTLYVTAINQLQIPCSDANLAIAASSLSNVFRALKDVNKKSDEFRNELPDDSKLHAFAREREFLERATEIMNLPVTIPDGVVDTESNLKPIVLRKNLYRLGLPYDHFDPLDGSIHTLLELRNKIAHGETQDGIDVELYNTLRDCASKVMTGITTGVTKALIDKDFLSTKAA